MSEFGCCGSEAESDEFSTDFGIEPFKTEMHNDARREGGNTFGTDTHAKDFIMAIPNEVKANLPLGATIGGTLATAAGLVAMGMGGAPILLGAVVGGVVGNKLGAWLQTKVR